MLIGIQLLKRNYQSFKAQCLLLRLVKTITACRQDYFNETGFKIAYAYMNEHDWTTLPVNYCDTFKFALIANHIIIPDKSMNNLHLDV